MIRQSSAGIYSWLPMGLKVLQNIEQIVREEQERAGSHRAPYADDTVRRSLARVWPI